MVVDILTLFTLDLLLQQLSIPPQWNLALGLVSAPPPTTGSLLEGVAVCSESWDTSVKNLVGSILAIIWEIPWLFTCCWYRNKASVPLRWGLC